MDALDSALSPADQAAFDLHILGCAACTTMLSDARRGAVWMEMLREPRPEPPADLLERIIAETSGKVTAPAALPAVPQNTLLGRSVLVPAPVFAEAAVANGNVLPFRSKVAASLRLRSIGQAMLQPRLAMTAAMAFFSIALTLNLTGVRVTQLRASDLKPANLKRTFYSANAHVVRYYDNLVVVYELESRVHELQRSSEPETPVSSEPADKTTPKPASSPAASPAASPTDSPNGQKPKQSKPGPGTSRREFPITIPGGSLHQVGSLPARSLFSRSTQALVVLLPSIINHPDKSIQKGELV